MKIEAGKYYRTRGGQKIGPMNVPPKGVLWSNAVIADCEYRGWLDGGMYLDSADRDEDLIAEWSDPADLTAITTPFGLLDAETQQALRDHGGPLEVYVKVNGKGYQWTDCGTLPIDTRQALAYRVKPKPATREEVLYWSTGGVASHVQCKWHTHKITITLEGDNPTAISITPLR